MSRVKLILMVCMVVSLFGANRALAQVICLGNTGGGNIVDCSVEFSDCANGTGDCWVCECLHSTNCEDYSYYKCEEPIHCSSALNCDR